MSLSDEQKATLREWVAGGAELGEIQNRLKEEFDLSLTYLDTRFLLDDLDLELVSDADDEAEDPAPETPLTDEAGTPPADGGLPDPPADAEPLDGIPDPEPAADDVGADGAPAGSVSLTVDTLTQPGSVVSGKVTFSDGNTAAWYLDQMGRLGLDPAQEGYQPPQEDIAAFQMELQKALRNQGF